MKIKNIQYFFIHSLKKTTLIFPFRGLSYCIYRIAKTIYYSYAKEFCPSYFGACQIVSDILSNQFGFKKSAETQSSVNQGGEPIPWYTYPAVEFLSQFDFSDKDVFEYGSGNSTKWWSAHAKNVTAVEHNPQWYNTMKESYSNVKITLVTQPLEYAKSIKKKYDVVIIDADWRDLCAQEAVSHLNAGGMIILDDSQRVQTNDEYRRALKHLQKGSCFIQIDFSGFTPITPYTKTTTIFLSRDFLLPRKCKYSPTPGIGSIIE